MCRRIYYQSVQCNYTTGPGRAALSVQYITVARQVANPSTTRRLLQQLQQTRPDRTARQRLHNSPLRPVVLFPYKDELDEQRRRFTSSVVYSSSSSAVRDGYGPASPPSTDRRRGHCP